MESLILACLAKRAADRPASADALERALSAMMVPNAWTQDDARAWWRDHREALVRLRAGRMTPGLDSVKPRILRSATLAPEPNSRAAAMVERG